MADDHPLFSEAIADQIGAALEDAQCTCVETLDEALQELNAGNADILILDWDMPGMNGLASVVDIRERFPSIPMVILSGFIDNIEIQEAMAAGVQGFVPKSMSGKAIISAISVVLNGGTYMPTRNSRADERRPEKERSSAANKQHPALTSRETEILRHLASGMTNKEIARQLGLQEVTIKMHTSRIFGKLNVRNRVQAVSLALAAGIVDQYAGN
ncbi:MAG: response regulator transcription factor [Parvibaculum sp.]|nr:response regulator transcription factor [Parvibaculum sp.]